jgi:AmmeMemoRadiSam system protein B
MACRRATHSDSWYTADSNQLNRELEGWLSGVKSAPTAARAVICPHAGYRYSGATAAHSFKQIDPATVRTIFILGPSHHVKLSGCAVSQCASYATPLYDLQIDTEITQDLLNTGEFELMSMEADEDEHSIEMQLPYIAKVMESVKGQFNIVPIMVGSLSSSGEAKYGKLLAKYLEDPSNCFVISSDFCHWGQRFRYTHYNQAHGDIYQSIEALDREGMELIESLDAPGFSSYLKKYGNTICGRHPIGVFLNMVSALRAGKNGIKMELSFLSYAQSNQVKQARDSSVSYAAAAFIMQ